MLTSRAVPWLLASLLPLGCQHTSHSDTAPTTQPTSPVQTAREVVLLRGEFVNVSRPVTGSVELVRKGEAYRLELRGVSVTFDGAVHVYLVGLEEAMTTRAVSSTDLKYDMGTLQQGQNQQSIDLPSEPDPRLRSVVLWSPAYGVNLASARLLPATSAH